MNREGSVACVALFALTLWAPSSSAGPIRTKRHDPIEIVFVDQGVSPTALAFDGRNIWVASSGDSEVLQIDPVTGEQLSFVPTPGAARSLLFDGVHIWI